jgi:cell division protein FtsB
MLTSTIQKSLSAGDGKAAIMLLAEELAGFEIIATRQIDNLKADNEKLREEIKKYLTGEKEETIK